jgi:hypothetical protein
VGVLLVSTAQVIEFYEIGLRPNALDVLVVRQLGISLPITTYDILILKQYPLNSQSRENVSLKALKLLIKATVLLLRNYPVIINQN